MHKNTTLDHRIPLFICIYNIQKYLWNTAIQYRDYFLEIYLPLSSRRR